MLVGFKTITGSVSVPITSEVLSLNSIGTGARTDTTQLLATLVLPKQLVMASRGLLRWLVVAGSCKARLAESDRGPCPCILSE